MKPPRNRNGIMTTACDPASLVCAAVKRDPDHYLDQKVTSFATPRSLLGGPPPSRWRPFARQRWFATLAERITIEVAAQERFSRVISMIRSKP